MRIRVSATLFFKRYKSFLHAFVGLVILSVFYTYLHYSSKETKNIVGEVFHQEISSMIPDGFVMVPVNLENHESVTGLIQIYAVVDLYHKSHSQLSPHKIAGAVRIIRTQTDQFSVLIPEEKVAPFIQSQYNLYAVIQNHKIKNSEIYPMKKKKKRFIIFEKQILKEFDEKI